MRALAAFLFAASMSAAAQQYENPEVVERAKLCARRWVANPDVPTRVRDITITHSGSFYETLDETVVVNFEGAGSVSAQFVRAAIKPYYFQCLQMEKHKSSAEKPRRFLPAYDMWNVADKTCPALKSDLVDIASTIRSSIETLNQKSLLRPAAPNTNKATTIKVRTDGPVYRVRMNLADMENLEATPGVDTALEMLVVSILRKASECASARPADVHSQGTPSLRSEPP